MEDLKRFLNQEETPEEETPATEEETSEEAGEPSAE
jgi:hypothetical protein